MSPAKANKTQDTPKKGPVKSPINETNLLFLWLCLHHNKGSSQPDYKAIADIMGISPRTANWRYSQLKAYFEEIGMPAGGALTRSATDDLAEPKTPKRTPRKTPKKTPKQGDDDDELENDLKPALKMEGVVIKKEEDQDSKLVPAIKMEDGSDA